MTYTAKAREIAEEPPVIIACQGPPRCLLTGDDAVHAATAGCVWCERIIIHDDGTEQIIKPGEA